MAFDRNVAFTICGVPAALEPTPSADVAASITHQRTLFIIALPFR
jgi:hypothetical protein